MAYGASGTGKTSVLGMRRVFAGGVFSMAVQAMWRELAAVQAHSCISVEVLFPGYDPGLLTPTVFRARRCKHSGPMAHGSTPSAYIRFPHLTCRHQDPQTQPADTGSHLDTCRCHSSSCIGTRSETF